MVKENRFRENTRAVWREAFEALERQPQSWREQVTRAVEALLEKLRRCANEDELHASYWRPGDWPSPVLLRHLPLNPGPDTVLELEDAAFWRRYLELAEGR
ncbi:MAG: hypothetical protein GEU75_16315 [Dehalococcoidia bacterium]|nr:hypothetical protein [Dehalococcoidia bacterium]